MPKKVVRCYQDKDQPANMQYKLQSFLLEKEKLVSDFQQWWEAVRDIPLGREKEYRELQTMQEELKKATAETAAKAQARCLQEEALLERQLNDPAVSMLGEREEKELKRRARPWRWQQRGMLLSRATSEQRTWTHTESPSSSPSSAERKRPSTAG